MIVETQALTTIGVGAQKTQTEAGDGALKIPNLLLPEIELQEATSIFPNLNVQQDSSFVVSRFLSRNNQVSGSTTFIQLMPGYWELFIDWSLKTNYAAAIPFNTAENIIRIISPIGGASMTLLGMFPLQSGYEHKQATFRLLLRDKADMQVVVGATGAADFLDTQVNCNGRKLL